MAHTPTYYKRGSIQVWDFIRDQDLNFHLGNSIKYICRYGHKGTYDDQVSDLKKAIHYLNDELNNLQRSRNIEDLSRLPQDSVVITGTGVPGGFQDTQFKVFTGPKQTEELDYGGVQGVLGSGRDALSIG